MEAIPLVNTIILIIIFFYQRNRNKILLERIDHQEKVINETKGIVTQQSTAIDSQSKVVDTAIKYSESFSSEKLEAIIRREIESEQNESMQKKLAEHANDIEHKKKSIEEAGSIAKSAIDIAKSIMTDYLYPYVQVITKILLRMSAEERQGVFDKMDDGEAKDKLLEIIDDVSKQVKLSVMK